MEKMVSSEYFCFNLALGTFYTFNRWGRVGYKGQSAMGEFDDVDDAIKDFNKKLREKINKGYVEVDISYDDDGDDDKEDTKTKKSTK